MGVFDRWPLLWGRSDVVVVQKRSHITENVIFVSIPLFGGSRFDRYIVSSRRMWLAGCILSRRCHKHIGLVLRIASRGIGCWFNKPSGILSLHVQPGGWDPRHHGVVRAGSRTQDSAHRNRCWGWRSCVCRRGAWATQVVTTTPKGRKAGRSRCPAGDAATAAASLM